MTGIPGRLKLNGQGVQAGLLTRQLALGLRVASPRLSNQINTRE